MEIHRFEKFWIWASVLLIIGYIGTVTYGAVGAGIKMIGNEGGQIENPSKPVESGNFREPGAYKIGEDHYAVYVKAQQFVFRPGTAKPITVPAGSKVTFHLTSPDVLHGFEVVGTNINSMVIPGQVSKFTARFDETNTYGIVCHEYCGTGHHLMEGQLKVVSPEKFKEAQQQ